MVRVSNTLIAIVNSLTLLCSIFVIGSSLWFYTHRGSSDCQTVIQQPLLILGLSVFVVSLLGLIGACCRVQWVLYLYLTVLFLLILGVFCFMIFSILVTNKRVGKQVSGMGFKEYRLGDYSHWLRKYVINNANWYKIRSCLDEADVCGGLVARGKVSVEEFYKRGLTPTESGCCKPPTYCGMEYHNATYWTMPKTGPKVEDSDCTTFSNNQTTLCFDCKSCRAGILDNIKREWRQLIVIDAVVLSTFIIIYALGACALRNNKDGYVRHKSNP